MVEVEVDVEVEHSGRTSAVKLGYGGTRPLIDRTIPRVHLSVGLLLSTKGARESLFWGMNAIFRDGGGSGFGLPLGAWTSKLAMFRRW